MVVSLPVVCRRMAVAWGSPRLLAEVAGGAESKHLQCAFPILTFGEGMSEVQPNYLGGPRSKKKKKKKKTFKN